MVMGQAQSCRSVGPQDYEIVKIPYMNQTMFIMRGLRSLEKDTTLDKKKTQGAGASLLPLQSSEGWKYTSPWNLILNTHRTQE